MAEQWYSIVEYARAYSISDMTVRRRIKNGKLHAVLKDGKYFIPVSESPAEPPRPKASKYDRAYSEPRQRATQDSYTPAYSSSYTPRETRAERPATHLAPAPKPEGHTAPRHFDNMPSAVHSPLASAERIVMKADHLLAFYDRMLGELQQSKQAHRDLYEAKIKTLEAKLAAKDIEIKQFRQQVEDLQVLVKILEKKAQS